MRILYGVVGEGMGHATRSRVVLDYLADRGHELLVVVSGRAYDFLSRHFAGRAGVRVEKIHGLRLVYQGNAVHIGESILGNLDELPENLRTNLEAYRRVVGTRFKPQAIFSDFDQWAYFYGRRHRVPVVSIDNMRILDRCRHAPEMLEGGEIDYNLARVAVKMKLAIAYHYLITSFFFPAIDDPRTTLVPPILRPEVLALRREPGKHLLVYQTATTNEGLIPILKSLSCEVRVYGMGREGQDGNLRFCPFSQDGFLEDLRTARAVVAGGGYSLLSEAVHLGVPVLSVPLADQFEQELNARYLAKLGYGAWTRKLDAGSISRFLDRLPEHEAALRTYPRQDNTFLFLCIEELLGYIQQRDPPPAALSRAPVLHHSCRAEAAHGAS